MLIYDKIKLRSIEFEDIKILNKWKNDKEIFKYLGGGYQPISESQQKMWMEKMVQNTDINKRFIILNEDDIAVGFIGLYDISGIHGTCSLGVYIGEKKFWGNGIAGRAYKALEEYAKNFLNIRKIKLEVVKDNLSAINLYKKLEFYCCGEYKEERYIDGKYRDVVLMEKFI